MNFSRRLWPFTENLLINESGDLGEGGGLLAIYMTEGSDVFFLGWKIYTLAIFLGRGI